MRIPDPNPARPRAHDPEPSRRTGTGSEYLTPEPDRMHPADAPGRGDRSRENAGIASEAAPPLPVLRPPTRPEPPPRRRIVRAAVSGGLVSTALLCSVGCVGWRTDATSLPAIVSRA
ncbi:MAG: hypothetical protein D6725_16475, partial [Planctomycetota bacterium]